MLLFADYASCHSLEGVIQVADVVAAGHMRQRVMMIYYALFRLPPFSPSAIIVVQHNNILQYSRHTLRARAIAFAFSRRYAKAYADGDAMPRGMANITPPPPPRHLMPPIRRRQPLRSDAAAAAMPLFFATPYVTCHVAAMLPIALMMLLTPLLLLILLCR